jgi:hypothetical protein
MVMQQNRETTHTLVKLRVLPQAVSGGGVTPLGLKEEIIAIEMM